MLMLILGATLIVVGIMIGIVIGAVLISVGQQNPKEKV